MLDEVVLALVISVAGYLVAYPLLTRVERRVGSGLHMLFLVALVLRLGLAILYSTGAEREMGLTKDGFRYDRQAWHLVESRRGTVPEITLPYRDEAYYHIVAGVYTVLGRRPLAAKALNCLAGAAMALLTLLIAFEIYGHPRMALAAGYVVALTPSFVHWSALLIKDALATVAVLAVVHALVSLRKAMRPWHLVQLGVALLLLLGLREYLFPILSVCAVVSLLALPMRELGWATWAGGVVAVLVVFLLGHFFGGGALGLDFLREEGLTDADRIAHLRDKLGRGSGSFGTGAAFGTLAGKLQALGKGITYFFVGLDVLRPRSARQLAAVPEAIAIVVFLPFVVWGIWCTVRTRLRAALPALVVGFVVMLAYSAITTNAGPLYRWRMQVFPLFLMFGMAGLLYARTALGRRAAP